MIDLRKLSEKPNIAQFEKHLWVDYFEMVALFEENTLTRSDLKDRLSPEYGDLNVDFKEEISEGGKTSSEKIENRIQDYFSHFHSRSRLYGTAYPFSVKRDRIERKKKMTANRLFYCYLLICSSLKYVNKNQSRLTSDFESLSLKCVKKLMNFSFGPYVYGKTQGNTSSRYVGNAFARIEKLADDLKGNLKANSSHFAPTSTGDSGIDIVASLGKEVDVDLGLVLVGQCKCSDTWREKSKAAEVFKKLISINEQLIDTYFIPFHYRKATSDWHTYHPNGLLLYDRQRLFRSKVSSEIVSFSSLKLVKEIL